MFVSEYMDIDYEDLDDAGVFDAVLEKDSAFFINVQRLKQTEEPEFLHSYERIRDFFTSIATILESADKKDISDKFYRAALNKFAFSEVNEINLGFGDSKAGSGMGPVLRKQVIDDAFDLVKKGCKAPELFEMIGLFEDGIGPDRLSDMIATIILPDIQAYTKRVMVDFEIDADHYEEDTFDSEGFVFNEFKGCRLYLLPVDILHELPVAKCWEDVETAASKNNAIRQEMNYEVGRTWHQWASRERKAYIRDYIMKDPDAFERVVAAYREEEADEYNLYNDPEYFLGKLLQKIKKAIDFTTAEEGEIDSLTGALEVADIFKDWVEHNRGWAEIQQAAGGEKSVQRFIHACAKHYIKVNNLDFSCEANEGPGPVDFKVSRGQDCTVVELKLSSNDDYMHGYQEQIQQYAEAEGTENMVFILVDNGHKIRTNRLREQNQKDVRVGLLVPEVVIVDANTRLSASRR